MMLHNPISHTRLSSKISGSQENSTDLSSVLFTSCCSDFIFATSTDTGSAGGSGRRKHTEEIKDESGLSSGAGVTSDATAANDDSGSTGPGSDRKGNKMAGEDGITSITDSIADAIDRAQTDDDTDERKTSKPGNQ